MPPRKCQTKTTFGHRCTRIACSGQNKCWQHGGAVKFLISKRHINDYIDLHARINCYKAIQKLGIEKMRKTNVFDKTIDDYEKYFKQSIYERIRNLPIGKFYNFVQTPSGEWRMDRENDIYKIESQIREMIFYNITYCQDQAFRFAERNLSLS